ECLIQEEFAWGCAGICGALTISNIPSIGLLLAGTEEQKKRLLAPVIADRKLVAYALTEPGAGSDVQKIRTAARKIGDEYSISGTKCFITIGDAASFYLLFAVTDPSKGYRGITAFFIPSDRAGVRIGPAEKKMGQMAAHIATLSFDEVKATSAEIIGGEGNGFKLAMEVFNRSRPTIAITAVGIARRAFELAAAYANERQTMGAPIIQHQGVGFMLADMDIAVQAARLLTHESAWLVDQGRDNRIQAARAKCFAADACMKVTTDAVQIYGGYGYMKEYPVEKLMRDAKVTQIYEGTTQIQRVIIAKSLTMSLQ
ncbi:acyl-CoA dehydrogenase family protein, partial [Candidatus Sumerlaeota bacterium]|nr:acyl-CoA dehydrogenase family protein [Candidatus Sumerlaeota bacterium]